MAQVGTGKYTYDHIQDYPKLPAGETFGLVSRVQVDSQDRIYLFQRKNPPVVVFDRDGKFLKSWGASAVTDPHGMRIVNDLVYITDREDSVAAVYTLDGKPLQILGKRGVHSDTGCEKPAGVVPRAAGPFNYPTELMPGPSGDLYATDGYRNSRVHRFTRDGKLVKSWGEPGSGPGQFHLPHCIAISPDETLYVGDRSNRRVQVFSADGKFIRMWNDMGGPNDIARDKDGIFYIAEQEADGRPPSVSVRDESGKILARWGVRHAHGMTVDSRGDIYVGLSSEKSVDKYVRRR